MRSWFLVGMAASLVASSACRDPTQITLEIHTNAPCNDTDGTAITVGLPLELEYRPPVAATSNCSADVDAMTPGGRVGSLVLIPGASDDDPVGVKVAMSVDGRVEDCMAPPYDPNCIIARRSLRYIPHTPLYLPIEMSLDCRGEHCDPKTTCFHGGCVDAEVDPFDCVDPAGCVLGGGGTSVGGSGSGGSGGSGGGTCGVTGNVAPTTLAPAPTQGPIAATADLASCRWAVAWGNGNDVCTQVLHAAATSDGPRFCHPHSGLVHDVAVALLPGGLTVTAGWSTESQTVWVWIDLSGVPVTNFSITGVLEGDLIAAPGGILLVSSALDGTIEYIQFSVQNGNFAQVGQAQLASLVPTNAAPVPDAALSGGDMTVAFWDGGSQGGVIRFDLASGPGANSITFFSARTQVAVANHEATSVVGLIASDSGDTADLATVSATSGYSPGQYAATYSATADHFDVTGTPGGWVVAWVDNATGHLVRYDAQAQTQGGPVPLASGMTNLAIAALAEHLGVAWLDSSGVHFRVGRSDLTSM